MTGNFGREFVETVALRESTIASGYPHSESDCEGLFTTKQQVEQLRAVATLDGPVPQIPSVVLLVAKREIYMRLLTRILTTSRWCRTARIRGGRFRASPCASCVIGIRCVHQRRDRRVQFGVQGTSDAPQWNATSCSTAASATARKGRRECRGWSPSECWFSPSWMQLSRTP